MNHRLELAVHDAVSTTNKVTQLRMFIDTLYWYYSRSPPKNCRLLQSASESLCVELHKVGKIFDVRWLASSYVSVGAVLKSARALVCQLENASNDRSSTAKDRAKAGGMCKKLHSWTFLAELALIKDILSVLKDLSLYLQSRSAAIFDVAGRLDTAGRTLTAMKSVDGLALSALNNQIAADGCYCGISVSRSSNDVQTFMQMRCQFIQDLVDNIIARFPDQQLQEAGAVLNLVSGPDDEVERALFGDRQVTHLAQLCGVDSRESLDDFRQYKNNTKVIGQALTVLMQQASCYLCHLRSASEVSRA